MRGSDGLRAATASALAVGRGRGYRQLFAGGPVEGWLQHVNPAVRLLAMVALIGGASMCHSAIPLAALMAGMLILALVAYLDIPSILLLIAAPMTVLVLPGWAVAVGFFDVPLQAAVAGLLRTGCCIAVGIVFLHSIGLMGFGAAMRRLGLPSELCLAWPMMVAQASGFSELTTEMALAREARYMGPIRGGLARRQIGGQMAFLLARMLRRGEELGLAMDAREIVSGAATSCGAEQNLCCKFRAKDFVFLICAAALAMGLALL